MTNQTTTDRYAAESLIAFASALLKQAGLADAYAATVAEILVEADLMGHSTHGLQLLAPYLQDLESGAMAASGDPITLADRGATVTWDGRYLPGPWLVTQAMELAFSRIKTHPVMTVVIQRSHHIACLGAYPKRATDRGLFMLLTSSDPSTSTVAPYGGIEPVYTPNPIAAGIPTPSDPIIMDISMSTTANGLVSRYHQAGRQLPSDWLLSREGRPSNDPADLFTDPPGSVQPLGSVDLGYKGFALGLLVEALTSALAGHGRAQNPPQWGASVFLQVIDPAAFGGLDSFVQETGWLAETVRSSAARPDQPPVRLPGERGLRLRAEQLETGVILYPSILPALAAWSEKLDVPLPSPITTA